MVRVVIVDKSDMFEVPTEKCYLVAVVIDGVEFTPFNPTFPWGMMEITEACQLAQKTSSILGVSYEMPK